MAESMMRQAMDTWLKKECVDTGFGFMHLSSYITDIRNHMFDRSMDGVEGARQGTIAELTKLESRGNLTAEESYFYKDWVDKSTNRFKHGLSTSNEEEQSEALHEIYRLVDKVGYLTLERTVECQCGKPHSSSANPYPRSKWCNKGMEASKTDTWMDIENTIKETAEKHPEIKDAYDLVWTDIDGWEETDYFNMKYGKEMWEDARQTAKKMKLEDDPVFIATEYNDVKSEFWEGFLYGKQEAGKDIYGIASELIKGR